MNMKVVVAHCGARDAYQVAAAVAESGMLDSLVTDLYWPADRAWARKVERWLGDGSAAKFLRMRYEPLVGSSRVKQCVVSGALAFGLRKSKAPFAWKRWAMRRGDAEVGSSAGRLAGKNRSALLSYSYYAHSAFTAASTDVPKILFQLHPHPLSVRRILTAELERYPECAESLGKEWELALPEEDFGKLVEETRMADRWIVASSFTRETMIEHGAAPEHIHVAPYGTDLGKFGAARHAGASSGPLKILFVGSINQRKGIRYLLEALSLLKTRRIEVTVCGRVVDDLSIFRPYQEWVTIRPSVSDRELIEAYQAADLFVFPSLAEGFGHVILEAMACGTPVLSTTRTAAADLITPGVEGFVVEPCRPDLLAERIDWALLHRRDLVEMGRLARATAEKYTWGRFRARVREILESLGAERTSVPAGVLADV
jgi:glycosyltransferase involved in cell wall biosynthesis